MSCAGRDCCVLRMRIPRRGVLRRFWRGATSLLAALAVASLAAAAPEPISKRHAADPATRSTDLKVESPGPGFEGRWAAFEQDAEVRAAGRAPMFGDGRLFVRFSAITGSPRLIYGDLGEAPPGEQPVDRAAAWIEANAEVAFG